MDIEIRGKWGQDGQMLVACGEHSFCFTNQPAPIVYKTFKTIQNQIPANTGHAMFAGGSTSLITTLITAWILKKLGIIGENKKGDSE